MIKPLSRFLLSREKRKSLYRNQLKNRFLVASAWKHIFGLRSRLAVRQWSLPPDTKICAASLPKTDSSIGFDIFLGTFFGCFLFFSVGVSAEFKLYCIYTPSFETLYQDYFLPSLQDDFEIVRKQSPQECPSGLYRSDGWEKTMLRKLELLREAVQEHWNDQIFFYSDVDIIFLKPVAKIALEILGDRDFVVQQGWPREGLCAGFFVMRGNEKTLKWINTALYLLESKQCVDDQVALQTALTDLKEGEIAWRFLPSEKFPNGRRVLKNHREERFYSINSEIALDDSIVLFHANCTLGLENKYHFLNQVLSEYRRKNREGSHDSK